MHVFIRRSIFARLIGALGVLSLSAGSAWAGGGGTDAVTLQTNLETLCHSVLKISFCPELPTASQMALSIAALRANPPELVRFAGGAFSPRDVITAVNPPAAPDVVPLAFITGQPASVTERGDPEATSLFTAATDRLTQTLTLTYDFSPPPPITKGQPFATLSLPLVILNSADSNGNFAETPAPTTIVIQAAAGTCKTPGCVPFSAQATTKALGAPAANVDPAKLGVIITVTTTGPAQSPHLVVTVQVQLVVWNSPDRDPSYFVEDPVLTGVEQFFRIKDPGFASTLLKSNQMGIGIAPYASPLCSGNIRCIENPPTPAYSYCATLGNGDQAVAAFLSIGKFGETYASALRSTAAAESGFTCPLQF